MDRSLVIGSINQDSVLRVGRHPGLGEGGTTGASPSSPAAKASTGSSPSISAHPYERLTGRRFMRAGSRKLWAVLLTLITGILATGCAHLENKELVIGDAGCDESVAVSNLTKALL